MHIGIVSNIKYIHYTNYLEILAGKIPPKIIKYIVCILVHIIIRGAIELVRGFSVFKSDTDGSV